MDTIPDILPMSRRRYAAIPVTRIKVLNSRNREADQFDMNVQSIGHVGLLKPIRVNDKFLERTGMYELVCGEGRLLAYQRLGHEAVPAEVVTCTRKEAYLVSLVENIARTKRGSMEFARELKRLRDEGWDYQRIATVACKCDSYIREYIRLVEQGEERLIQGVEQDVFPITFAVQVAFSDDAQIQHVLMDAFDEGLVTTTNFAQARKIITARSREAKKRQHGAVYTVSQLKQDIEEATQVKTSYVREAKTKEHRFVALLTGINGLWKDAEFVRLLTQEKLSERPQLAGDFAYEASPPGDSP